MEKLSCTQIFIQWAKPVHSADEEWNSTRLWIGGLRGNFSNESPSELKNGHSISVLWCRDNEMMFCRTLENRSGHPAHNRSNRKNGRSCKNGTIAHVSAASSLKYDLAIFTEWLELGLIPDRFNDTVFTGPRQTMLSVTIDENNPILWVKYVKVLL